MNSDSGRQVARRKPLVRLKALLVVLAAGATGCGGIVTKPLPAPARTVVPELHRVGGDVSKLAGQPIPALISHSFKRKAEEMVVRVRNVNCEGIATGTGFAIDKTTLVTNRHVLAGASELDVSTWDGHDLNVSTADVGALVDLGVADVDGNLPAVATAYANPSQRERITVVGFPLGGPLTFSTGQIIDFVNGTNLGIPGRVMRMTANVEPGSSGSPVIDSKGRVVGIVYAIETATGYGLAIPLGTLKTLIHAGGFVDVPPCGSE
jgi:S1-C subfamily serine protease